MEFPTPILLQRKTRIGFTVAHFWSSYIWGARYVSLNQTFLLSKCHATTKTIFKLNYICTLIVDIMNKR